MIEQRIEEVSRVNQAFYEAFESLDIHHLEKLKER